MNCPSCREAAKGAEPQHKKPKMDAGMRAQAMADDDMFQTKPPPVRANAGGMPATVKKVRVPPIRRSPPCFQSGARVRGEVGAHSVNALHVS